MIILYFTVGFDPCRRQYWRSASLFSLFPWLINSAVVLPLLGQGFAGLYRLRWQDALFFFIANWAFVFISAFCYSFFHCPEKDGTVESREQTL